MAEFTSEGANGYMQLALPEPTLANKLVTEHLEREVLRYYFRASAHLADIGLVVTEPNEISAGSNYLLFNDSGGQDGQRVSANNSMRLRIPSRLLERVELMHTAYLTSERAKTWKPADANGSQLETPRLFSALDAAHDGDTLDAGQDVSDLSDYNTATDNTVAIVEDS